jgi:hypothetical protein
MPTITPLGWIGIIILFNTTLIGGSSQLADLFLSASAVKALLALATLGNGFLGGLVTMLSTQSASMKQVASIQGDDGKPALRISVNANATPAEAAVALDPTQPNVGAATPQIREALKDAAKSAAA